MRSVFALIAAWSLGSLAQADEINVEIHQINSQGVGPAIGFIRAADSPAGLVLTPDVKGLAPGPHGFHVHEFASCGPGEKDGKPATNIAAGNHFDPKGTGKHAGPTGEGHLGDLPVLKVEADGIAREPVTAGRLRVADLKGRSLMIHAENDNYADKPGGARIACGAIN
jgi:Cu-Zn family superoxide dismutase